MENGLGIFASKCVFQKSNNNNKRITLLSISIIINNNIVVLFAQHRHLSINTIRKHLRTTDSSWTFVGRRCCRATQTQADLTENRFSPTNCCLFRYLYMPPRELVSFPVQRIFCFLSFYRILIYFLLSFRWIAVNCDVVWLTTRVCA